jgi:hypothetical protein
MTYPNIEGKSVKHEREELEVKISLAEKNSLNLQESKQGCLACMFHGLARVEYRNAWIRCKGIDKKGNGNINIQGSLGQRVGEYISENAPCKINPTNLA